MNARFPAAVRVRTGRDYRDAFADSRRVSTRHFSLHLRQRDGGFCRLGMAVSRKVSPHAVVRNRIKRQIRETFRLRRGTLPGGDCIVVARQGAGALDRAALRADLALLWDRLLALPPASPDGTIGPPGATRATPRPAGAPPTTQTPPASPVTDGHPPTGPRGD